MNTGQTVYEQPQATEPTREYMLEIIQKEISDKTLSFGCVFIMKNIYNKKGLKCRVNDEDTYAPICNSYGGTYHLTHLDEGCEDGCKMMKIIGHPVFIGDVFDWIGKTGNYLDKYYEDTMDNILFYRKEKRKPIQDQSHECISYIRSKLPPEVRK